MSDLQYARYFVAAQAIYREPELLIQAVESPFSPFRLFVKRDDPESVFADAERSSLSGTVHCFEDDVAIGIAVVIDFDVCV